MTQIKNKKEMGDLNFFKPLSNDENYEFDKNGVLDEKHVIFQIIYATARAHITNTGFVNIETKKDITHDLIETPVKSYKVGFFVFTFINQSTIGQATKYIDEIRLTKDALVNKVLSRYIEDKQTLNLSQTTIIASLIRDMFGKSNNNIKKLIADMENENNENNKKYGIFGYFFHPYFINKDTTNVALVKEADPVMKMKLFDTPTYLARSDSKYLIDPNGVTTIPKLLNEATKDTIFNVLLKITKFSDNDWRIFLAFCTNNWKCIQSDYVEQLREKTKNGEPDNWERLKKIFGESFVETPLHEMFVKSFQNTQTIMNFESLRDKMLTYYKFVEGLHYSVYLDDKYLSGSDIRYINPVEEQKNMYVVDKKDTYQESFLKLINYLKTNRSKLIGIKDDRVDIGGFVEMFASEANNIFRYIIYANAFAYEFKEYVFETPDGISVKTKPQKETTNPPKDALLLKFSDDGYFIPRFYLEYLYFLYSLIWINKNWLNESVTLTQNERKTRDIKIQRDFVTLFKEARAKNNTFDSLYEEFKNTIEQNNWKDRINKEYEKTELQQVTIEQKKKFDKNYVELDETEQKRFKEAHYTVAFNLLYDLLKQDVRFATKLTLKPKNQEQATILNFEYYNPILESISDLFPNMEIDNDDDKETKKLKEEIAKIASMYWPEYMQKTILGDYNQPLSFNDTGKSAIIRNYLSITTIGIPTSDNLEYQILLQKLLFMLLILIGYKEPLITEQDSRDRNLASNYAELPVKILVQQKENYLNILRKYYKQGLQSFSLSSDPLHPTPSAPPLVVKTKTEINVLDATFNWNNIISLDNLDKLTLADCMNIPISVFEKLEKDQQEVILQIFGGSTKTGFLVKELENFKEKHKAEYEKLIDNELENLVSLIRGSTLKDKKKAAVVKDAQKTWFELVYPLSARPPYRRSYSKEGWKTMSKNVLQYIYTTNDKVRDILDNPIEIMDMIKQDGYYKRGGFIEYDTKEMVDKSDYILVSNWKNMGHLLFYFTDLIVFLFEEKPDDQQIKNSYRQILLRAGVQEHPLFTTDVPEPKIEKIKSILENVERDEKYRNQDGSYNHETLREDIFSVVDSCAAKHWETISKSVPWKKTFEKLDINPTTGQGIGLDPSWGHDVSTKYLHCLSLIAGVLHSLETEQLVEEDMLVRCNAEWPKEMFKK